MAVLVSLIVYRRGFYPLTRALADLRLRIAERDAPQARELVAPWDDTPQLLLRRLALFAYEHEAFSPVEAAVSVRKLDEGMFWGNARVEIMRLLTKRWGQFDQTDRLAIEARLRQGEPRRLYPADAFENDDEWSSIHDSSVFRRLKRIELAGGALTADKGRSRGGISAAARLTTGRQTIIVTTQL
jgi:hypothetical protein